MAAESEKYQIKTAKSVSGGLEIEWGDGHTSNFDPMWLRHQCECKLCGTPMNAVRSLRLHHIPDDISLSITGHSAGQVGVIWNNDNHRSIYDAHWLRDHCYSSAERRNRKHRPVLWDGSLENGGPAFGYEAARQHDSARLEMLQAVRDYGFCKLTGVPPDEEHSQKLIELVGRQRQTHFGTYKLTKKKSVDNVGDNTDPLDPHMDETYRLSNIGITVFQVLRPSSNGGDSTLVDGYEAARRMREAYPDDFDLLTRVPVTGQRLDRGHNTGGQKRWFVARMPVIKVDDDGDISGLRLNERQIGPLDVVSELVGPTYRALKRLFDFVYNPGLVLKFPLKAGEGLVFDNHRILHGRTGFTAEDPPRSVLTSSVDLEEFHSNLRTLELASGYTGPQILLAQGIGS